MRKLQIEDADVMRTALQQEIARSEESRYDHRLHGLLLVTAGQSCRQVAELFGENGTTVQRWVRRFEQGGLEALREGERSGRPSALDAGQWRKLQGDLRKTPRDFGIPATLWDGPLLSEHLRRHYGVPLGVRQCQRLFRRMGFRLRKPRPQVAQADPLKVAEVKKLRRLARRTTLSCGAWTNATFSNTARAVACGCLPRIRTRFCCMLPPASPSPALVQSICETSTQRLLGLHHSSAVKELRSGAYRFGARSLVSPVWSQSMIRRAWCYCGISRVGISTLKAVRPRIFLRDHTRNSLGQEQCASDIPCVVTADRAAR
jgi:transposase